MTAPIDTPSIGTPWYRNFWPWFIVILMGISIIAALYTVWIAVVNRDSLVSGDWYEDGLAINRRLERVDAARALGVVAHVAIDAASRDITLSLAGRELGDVPGLRLSFSHPTISDQDQQLVLTRQRDGRYAGTAAAALSGRWYATLEPESRPDAGDAPSWRLSEQVTIPEGGFIVLGESP